MTNRPLCAIPNCGNIAPIASAFCYAHRDRICPNGLQKRLDQACALLRRHNEVCQFEGLVADTDSFLWHEKHGDRP